MKPGTVKPADVGSVVSFDQATPVAEVDPVVQQKRVNLDELPDGTPRSQLPSRPASTVESPGTSPLVQSRLDAEAREEESQRPKGKRQKFLKVTEAKGLTKPAKLIFKSLSDLLDRGVQTLRQRRDVKSDFGSEDA